MTRLVFALFLMLASQAWAEVIKVQTGDHPGFTRLVLAIPAGRDWRLGRQGNGYEIESGDATDSFDLRSAFDLIGRDRLAGLTTEVHRGRLNLTLACLCHATATRWQTDWLIVDIVDGPAPPASPFEMPLDRLTEPMVADADSASLDGFAIAPFAGKLAEFGLVPANPVAEKADDTLILPLVMIGQSDVALPAMIPTSPPIPTDNAPSELSENNEQIGAAEQAIIESFARAASQGVLDVAAAPVPMAKPEDPQDQPAHETDDHMADTHMSAGTLDAQLHPLNAKPNSLLQFVLQPLDPDQPGITSHTSFDQNLPPVQPLDASTATGDRCLDSALFEMEEWGDERDFSTQIGEKLSALTTEFDVYPEGSVEALVRNYLYFGFGREALQALKLDGSDSQQRRVMAAMAHVTDQESDPSGLLESQLGCATQAAIWTTLSRRTLVGTTAVERAAATEGFRTLPSMLRGHLGVQFAQILTNFGDTHTADSVLNSAREHVTADRPETDIAAADIALVTQGSAAAIPALEAIAAEDIRLTPAALVQLITLTLDDGQELDPELISLADSMIFEHRGEQTGAALIAVQARALTARGAYNEALFLLEGDVAPMDAGQVAALRSAAIQSLTNTSVDAAFLNFAFDALPETGSAAVENAVATRLLTLGFADRAGTLLISPATGADARDRKYLQADIAIAQGEYTAVEGYLAGMSDPRAAETKARALAAQGDFAAASSSQDILPGTATDPAEAWRAGEWSVLVQSDDPLLQAASDAILATPGVLDPKTTLAASRALLEQATATQDLAGQLLDRFAIDPAMAPPASN